ncbi:MAG: double-strand break repair protein AddB [Alphaproteobacteria bacterium]|nr:double-strand break repair protein AddB [Alphaproteobacteria bacterium]
MPNVYNIPSEYSFLESFAIGLLQLSKKDPFALSQMEVFLPTRRACIEVRRAMLRHEKTRCFLLPKLTPLGDLDEDEAFIHSPIDEDGLPPLLPPFNRLSLLTKLIEEYAEKSGVPSTPALSLKLAKSLVSLMDQAVIENVPWEGLLHLVPSEFASHWQLTLDFLEIITTHWPKILEEKGVIEPHTRHHQLVQKIIGRWEKSPPSHPIMAAGSTGTMPATCTLLQAIANMPQGAIILPGLDTTLTKEEVRSLSPCHPQYAPTQFLQKMNLLPSEIQLWGGLQGQRAQCPERVHLFAQSLKPSFSTTGPSPEKALEGVYRVLCPSPQEEALAISILLRQQLEIPHQRIALITSDLKLTERVREELKRWAIDIDSSAGEPLNQTPPGVFLNLCVEFAANPQDQIALLSLLKHPLCHLTSRSKVRRFEKRVLRGTSRAHPTSVIPAKVGTQENIDLNTPESRTLRKAKLTQRFSKFRDDASGGDRREDNTPWLKTFQDLFFPFTEINKAPLEHLLSLHVTVAEALSRDDKGACQLWKGVKGEALKTFFNDLKKATYEFPALTLKEYASVFKEFMGGQKLRFHPQRHPRLAILGTIEARLFHADVMILGGLNEGNWPPEIGLDPWLNRPMRKELGFPPLERRIGLSAHDFGQAFARPKVYLTRSLKIDGTPTIACRWLERLDVYLKSWNLAFPEEPRVLEWVKHLDQPDAYKTPSPPLPSPPASLRPRRLSVTQIETWMRDPYALYARTILGLAPLDPLNAEVGPADRGTLLHKIFEEFFKLCKDPHHKDSLEILLFIGKTLFDPFEESSSVKLFWWPRFTHLAQWFITHEKATRLSGTQTFTEVKGRLTFNTPQGPFECTAKADRIDLLPDGRLRILDYKTGMPPSEQDVTLGFSPQLPLEGAIALAKGFDGITTTAIESLQFWWLKGDREGGIVRTLSGDPHERSVKALEGLKRMVILFEDERIPYPARPLPSKALRYNDYEQLARLQEWGKS